MPVVAEAPAQVKDWKFQTDSVVMLPYVEDNNASGEALPETVLATLYQKTKDQNLIERVFPAMEKRATLNRFIAHMYGKPILIGFLKGEVNRLAVYAWLYDICGTVEERRAWMGFCFFKEVWGRPEVRTLADFAFKWWFDELNVRILYGSILCRNKLAQNFARGIGFVSMGRAPHWMFDGKKFSDANLVYLTRERWNERS